VVGVDLIEEGEAAAAGEFEVEEDEVNGTMGKGLAGGGEGVGGLSKEAEGGGDLGAGGADRGVVVYDEEVEWMGVRLRGYLGGTGLGQGRRSRREE
jgi:hypothetical protein